MSSAVNILELHKKRLIDDTNNKKPMPNRMSLYEIVDKVATHMLQSNGEFLTKVSLGHIPEDELERVIEREIYKNGFKMKDISSSQLACEIKKHLIGYGPVDEYVKDEECSNIYFNAPSDVWVQIGSERIKTDIDFGSAENLMTYIRTIQGVLGGSLNHDEALVKLIDEKNKLRIIVAIDPISHMSPIMIIRKHRQNAFNLEELREMGMMDMGIYRDLKRIAEKGDVSIMFTGKGAAGKTTLMRAMAEHIDAPNNFKKRILVMEEHPELFLKRPSTNQFLVKRDKGREYGIEKFTDFGNLMSIDMYIFGEIRGGEALPFFDGAFAGNITWNTSHADSSERAIPKMAINMKKSGTDISIDILERQLYESVDLIVHMENFVVKEVTEVLKNGILHPIYRFEPKIKTATFMTGKFNKIADFKSKKFKCDSEAETEFKTNEKEMGA